MRRPRSMWSLETLGRVRLSRHFYMRDFLYSEIGNFHQIQNIPDDPERAIEMGQRLCQELLDPLEETFGRIAIRSGYRAAGLNRFGNEQGLNCARNAANAGQHIWDYPGGAGACTSLVIPWFADRYEAGRDWRDLAWWLHDHLPYSDIYFFPKLCAFNLSWAERPERAIRSYIAPRGTLLASGAEPGESRAERQARYDDFPPFRAIAYP